MTNLRQDASKPPNHHNEVLAYTDENEFVVVWYAENLGWWYLDDSPFFGVVYWWELPEV